jgi:hypothetical protein
MQCDCRVHVQKDIFSDTTQHDHFCTPTKSRTGFPESTAMLDLRRCRCGESYLPMSLIKVCLSKCHRLIIFCRSCITNKSEIRKRAIEQAKNTSTSITDLSTYCCLPFSSVALLLSVQRRAERWRLLCARGEWPRGRAAEQSDELAPFHHEQKFRPARPTGSKLRSEQKLACLRGRAGSNLALLRHCPDVGLWHTAGRGNCPQLEKADMRALTRVRVMTLAV